MLGEVRSDTGDLEANATDPLAYFLKAPLDSKGKAKAGASSCSDACLLALD